MGAGCWELGAAGVGMALDGEDLAKMEVAMGAKWVPMGAWGGGIGWCLAVAARSEAGRWVQWDLAGGVQGSRCQWGTQPMQPNSGACERLERLERL